jgi:hypothetical protein
MKLLRPLLILTLLCAPLAQAADPACAVAGLHETHCREPVMGEWQMWRYVLNDRLGPLRSSEAAAVDDAVRVLRESYPCGITHADTPAPYATTANLWSWPIREDAMRIQFIGFIATDMRTCSGSFSEQRGFVLIRRERKVACPKDFNWMVRDDKPGLCIRD